MKKYILILTLLLSVNAFANYGILRENYRKAMRYYNKKNYNKSASYFLSVVREPLSRKTGNMKAISFLMLGKCYNKLGQYNAAEYYLYQVFRNTPMNKYYKEGLLEIAKTFIFSKRYKNAIEVYNYIDNKFHDYKYLSEAMYLKGEVYLLINNKNKAISAYRYIVENYRNTKRYAYAKKRLKELLGQTSGTASSSAGTTQTQPGTGTATTTTPQIDVPTEEFYNQARELEATKIKISALERELSAAKADLKAYSQELINAKKEIERLKKENLAIRQNQASSANRQSQGSTATGSNGNTAASGSDSSSGTAPTGGRTTQTTQRQTPVEPRPADRVPDIRFPSFRSYYPPNQGFARRLRYDFLRGISNLSEEDLKKLEARLRLLERREMELSRIRKELAAFHKLLITKDRLLYLKHKALALLKNQIKQKEDALLKLMKLKKEMERRLSSLQNANRRNN